MVVLKTERLLARAAQLSRDSLEYGAQELAVEQRKVRAEFVFMMGGELADENDHTGDLDDLGEEAEAEAEDDILAGRLENQGRVALMRAVRSMSRASAAFNVAELQPALTAARAALAQIELAFSRSRILLRALSEREALDPARRLTGDLSEARAVQRAVVRPESDATVRALRQSLGQLSLLAGARANEPLPADSLARLAQVLLQQNVVSDDMRAVADMLSGAATAASGGRQAQARSEVERAVLALSALLRQRLPIATEAAAPRESQRLRGELADVLRGTARSASPAGRVP
jgi:hypothetical protein